MEFTTSVDPFKLLAGVGAGIFITIFVVLLLLFILQTICIMKLYKKAGKPGIAAWIPFWNTWVMFDIAYGKGYLMFLYLVPPFILPLVFFSYRDFCVAMATTGVWSVMRAIGPCFNSPAA